MSKPTRLVHDVELTIRYNVPGLQDNTAPIDFDLLSIACDPVNDISGWERSLH